MIASATEIEVELNVPEEVSTFFGVTWAQDCLKDKVFIKAFPRGANGRMGLLESTGLVEIGDCLTSINGVPLGKATLQEVMANIRSAKSPLSLRFARYPVPPPPQLSMPTSPASTIGSSSKSRGEGGFDSSSPNDARQVEATPSGAVGTSEHERREDAELDDVLNSALLVGLGERVADIQKRNAKLLQAVGRVGHAASVKRDGVERVASAAAALTAEAATLPRTLETLTAARQNASAVCEAMARLNELLAARERAQEARRRTNEEGALSVAVSSGNSASQARAQATTKSR